MQIDAVVTDADAVGEEFGFALFAILAGINLPRGFAHVMFEHGEFRLDAA